jgi:hypothetical protein
VVFLTLSSVAGSDAYAKSPAPTLTEKDVARAESIIAKLRGMERLTVEGADSEKRRKLVEKIYPGLFIQVAELRASDLKTDLTTAVFLYEEALRGQSGSNSISLDCKDEPRALYAKLCVENQAGNLPDFLRAKARLHTNWAEGLVNYHRGIVDSATASVLEEIREERRNDLMLAGQALAALNSLEKKIYNYSSLADFEEHRKLASQPFEQFFEDAAEALQSIDRILLSLPRGPLFYPLYHARNSYTDGLFWWQKTYRRSQLVVNVNAFHEPDEMKSSRLDAGAANYAVVINWRNAIRHTREAASMIEALQTSEPFHRPRS